MQFSFCRLELSKSIYNRFSQHFACHSRVMNPYVYGRSFPEKAKSKYSLSLSTSGSKSLLFV